LWAGRIANRRRDAATRRRYIQLYERQSAGEVHSAVEVYELDYDVFELLDQLECATREVLVLRYLDDLPLSRIANLLGLELSAVKMRLVRAREALRAMAESQAA
jgi:RNA polymerase sigma factor (sigma-70 family)